MGVCCFGPHIDKEKLIPIDEFTKLIPKEIYNKMNLKSDIDNKNYKTTKEEVIYSKGKETFYYHGEYVNNQMDGKGYLVIVNQEQKPTIYQGIWEYGKITSGKIYYIDGSIYEGDIVNYIPSGKGKLISDTEKYEGDWKNNKKDGKGKLTNSSGIMYEGEFKNDAFSGQGKMIWKNGTKYEGAFLNNQFHGFGCLTGQNSHVYSGNFVNGLFHGEGQFEWNEENNNINTKQTYKGNYSLGKKNGHGKFTFKDGNTFDGMWESGEPHGEGIFETKNRKYHGNWRAGQFIQVIKIEDITKEEENVDLNFEVPNEDIVIKDSLRYSISSVLSSRAEETPFTYEVVV